MKKGMIKVSVLYTNGDNKKFDMEYYNNSHCHLFHLLEYVMKIFFLYTFHSKIFCLKKL